MIEQRLATVLRFVADNDGASVPRMAKQLGFSQSELLRLLAMLGQDQALGGLGLIESRENGSRRLLSLSESGRDWLAKHQ